VRRGDGGIDGGEMEIGGEWASWREERGCRGCGGGCKGGGGFFKYISLSMVLLIWKEGPLILPAVQSMARKNLDRNQEIHKILSRKSQREKLKNPSNSYSIRRILGSKSRRLGLDLQDIELEFESDLIQKISDRESQRW
jgi:hypothetical protein